MTDTPEEAKATEQANVLIENNLSSVKIIHKVEMKTGKSFTEWEIKIKSEDGRQAEEVAVSMDERLKVKYGTI